MRSFRSKVQQRLDRLPGAAACFCLNRLSKQDERGDDRCRFKVETDLTVAPERLRKNPRREYCNSAIEIRGADADGDQREHIEAAINNRSPGACEEKVASPKDYRGCKGKFDPFRNLFRDHRVHVQSRNCVTHRDKQHRNREDECAPEFSRQRANFLLFLFVTCPNRLWLQCHSAFRAVAGMILLDLRMHRTGVDHGGLLAS